MSIISGRTHAADQQLDLFASRLSRRPYCTDNLADGLRILPAIQALERRYIQCNQPATIHWLPFDIDRAYFQGDWRTKAVPNIIVRNPVNSHAHLLYGLVTPVTRTSAGRTAPLRYLANIAEAMRHELDADPGYGGLIVKNPLNRHWQVETPRAALYELSELDQHCDLVASAARIKATPRRQLSGLGRNCSLFDSLRVWAYKEITRYRSSLLPAGFDGWNDTVAQKACRLNVFASPLPDAEIRAIARSVSKWTWSHYDGTGSAPDAVFDGLPANTLSLLKSSLGKMGMESRWGDNTDKQAEAVKMAAGGVPQTEIADQLEVNQATISRWLKHAG